MTPPSTKAEAEASAEDIILEVKGLYASYGSILALKDIHIRVPRSGIVTLIGANGAGKSTTLRAISGLVSSCTGSIFFEGEEILHRPAHEIVRRGVIHVPEGRMIFPEFSVQENLFMGAYGIRNRSLIASRKEEVFEFFPRLKERRNQAAGTLSGGEQQMLAIGRALMRAPYFLMLDEPSLGIAPLLVASIFERLLEIRKQRNMTLLLVEQNANLALEISDTAYVLETGQITLHGPSASLKSHPQIQSAYLGR